MTPQPLLGSDYIALLAFFCKNPKAFLIPKPIAQHERPIGTTIAIIARTVGTIELAKPVIVVTTAGSNKLTPPDINKNLPKFNLYNPFRVIY